VIMEFELSYVFLWQTDRHLAESSWDEAAECKNASAHSSSGLLLFVKHEWSHSAYAG
jgi:hypothetical protein